MKVILSRLPILLLMLYSISYPVEFSEDTVVVSIFKLPSPSINIVNDSNYEIILDSLKIKLIEGVIFKEMFLLLDSSNSEFFHYTILKEKDSTFLFKLYKNNYDHSKIIVPARSLRKIEEIEAGSNLNIVELQQSGPPKISNESTALQYTIRLTIYANDNTTSDVIIKGYNRDYPSNIKQNKLFRYRNAANLHYSTYDILGRCIEPEFHAGSKIIFTRNNEKWLKTLPIFLK